MKSIITLLLLLAVIIIIASGCYTILRHPVDEETQSSHEYQYDCIKCHPDYHNYPYGYFYGNYPNYWWSTPRWGHYYAYPWWWDYYWYKDDYYIVDEPDQSVGSGEKEVRRDALRPPYSDGVIMPLNPAVGSHENSTSTGTKPSVPEDKPKSDDKKEEKKKETESDGKKASRRGGREPIE
jgi:hypothetical protein